MDPQLPVIHPESQLSEPDLIPSAPITEPIPNPTLPVMPETNPTLLLKNTHQHHFLFGFLVVVIFAAVMSGVYIWQHDKVNNLNKQVSSLQNQVSEGSINALEAGLPKPNGQLSNLATAIGKIQYSIIKQYNSIWVDPEDSNNVGTVTYYAPNASYPVLVPDTNELNLATSNSTSQTQINTVVQSVSSLLKSSGLDYVQNSPIAIKDPSNIVNPSSSYDQPNTGYYSGNNSVCLLGANVDSDLNISYIILDCTTDAVLTNMTTAVAPFAQAYDEAPSSQTTVFPNPIYGAPNIISSGIDNYAYATISIGDAKSMGPGALAYFYTNKSGLDWRFALSSEEGVICSNLPNSDANQALSSICGSGD